MTAQPARIVMLEEEWELPGDPLGRAIRALSRSLGIVDRRFFEDVAAGFQRVGGGTADMTPYPIIPKEAFVKGVSLGWIAGQTRVRSAVAEWADRVWSEYGPGTATNPIRQLVLPKELLLPPTESIERYVANRIPPLKHDIEVARRHLCRDIIAEQAREGRGIRPTMEALERQGFGRSAAHRETIARTEAAHLYGHGSVMRARQSGAVIGYRFQAIIDERTTDICRDLHGREFKLDEVGDVSPPMHFNCRSELVPILFDEEPDWSDPTVTEDLPPGSQPLPGFGKIDLSDMPQPRPIEEFLLPLKQSDRADIQRVIRRIDDKLRRM